VVVMALVCGGSNRGTRSLSLSWYHYYLAPAAAAAHTGNVTTIDQAPQALPAPTTSTSPGRNGNGVRNGAPGAQRRTELAEFLRARRGRISPADVGLPLGLRRRTPGLRREEVAQLAGWG
jgi:hypothetical protein